jgi:hypothetical protein
MDPYSPYSRSHPAVVVPDGYRNQRPPPPQSTAPPTTPNRASHGPVVGDYALRSKYRIPTLDEALPFAPLTSILPYSPGTLPPPTTLYPSCVFTFVVAWTLGPATRCLLGCSHFPFTLTVSPLPPRSTQTFLNHLSFLLLLLAITLRLA